MDHLHFLCCVICVLTMFEFSLTIDTLSPNQTLDDGQVLTSPSQEFELGFFSPGKSTFRFLGIWYKATPDVVVWVANRNDPIMNPPGVLTVAANGTLFLTTTDQRSIFWSLNPSRLPSTTPALQLLDSGNLVLVDNSSTIWQSFDYPTDTRLPGMKMVQDPDSGIGKYLTSWKSDDDPSVGEFSFRIENNGLSQTVMKDGNRKRFRGFFWNGYFPGYPIAPDQAWNNEVETSRGRMVSLFNIFNGSSITRLKLNSSGLLQRYMMTEQGDGWTLLAEAPRYTCEEYGFCGNNSICVIGNTPECECLKGFKPKSEREWGIFEWKSGCYRNLPSDCQKEDGFLRFEGVKFPDSLDFRLNTSMNIRECHDECLNNCNCTAYADPLSNNDTSCLMWFGDLIDVEELNNGDSRPSPNVYIRVPASELDRKEKKKGSAKTKLISAAAASGVGLLILGLIFGCLLLRMRRKRRAYITKTTAYTKTREELELPLYDLATIAAATNNFATENLIGEGGFGPVYKGYLSAKRVIAVKRMSRTSGQGPEEFKNEINLIAKLQHRNLVRILGCCIDGEEKMLIYEYMHNKSLDYFIFDENRSAELSWPKRFDIIMGIARGLLYLHHDSRLKIIHRDLKTSNILLDENLNSKISDFGLARMFEGDQTIERTKRVAGTYGYMAPEYAFNGKFSIKSDIFSLGVVILEIVSGKKNRGFEHCSLYQNLLEQAWVYCMEGRELELMDPRYIINTYEESQVKKCIKVGLLCVQNSADDRPMMSSVLVMLSSDDTVLPQPKKPGFFLQSSRRFSNSGGDKSSSSNSMSVTDMEAR